MLAGDRMLIAADDRTGALEAAGAIAARIGRSVRVVVHGAHHGEPDVGPVDDSEELIVVDLASRHLSGSEAAARSAQYIGAGLAGHKIDSMLRGNWAAEVLARSTRVVVVPALPGAHRLCRDGIVYDHDVPISAGAAGRDARRAVRSSRPADHLRDAGAISVDELGDVDALERWLAGTGPCAVMDASSDADLDHIARCWASSPSSASVLLAGTSAVLGAGAVAVFGELHVEGAPRPLPAPVLVVCGSLHDGARAEVAALAGSGVTVDVIEVGGDGSATMPRATRAALAAGEPAVVTTALPARLPVTALEAEAAAAGLARVAATMVVGTLVVIGGDLAAMILGPSDRWVSGLLAPGTPWCAPSGDQPMIVTRAGGLGAAVTMEELVLGRMGP